MTRMERLLEEGGDKMQKLEEEKAELGRRVAELEHVVEFHRRVLIDIQRWVAAQDWRNQKIERAPEPGRVALKDVTFGYDSEGRPNKVELLSPDERYLFNAAAVKK